MNWASLNWQVRSKRDDPVPDERNSPAVSRILFVDEENSGLASQATLVIPASGWRNRNERSVPFNGRSEMAKAVSTPDWFRDLRQDYRCRTVSVECQRTHGVTTASSSRRMARDGFGGGQERQP